LKWRDIAWWATASVLGVGLVFHFGPRATTLTTASQPSLIWRSWTDRGLRRSDIHPDGGLFAPDPISADCAAYARGYYHDGAAGDRDVTDRLHRSVPRQGMSRITPPNLTMTGLVEGDDEHLHGNQNRRS
jgi:hypothetical protein